MPYSSSIFLELVGNPLFCTEIKFTVVSLGQQKDVLEEWLLVPSTWFMLNCIHSVSTGQNFAYSNIN